MYVVFSEAFEPLDDPRQQAVSTLEQTFAQVCYKAGLNYHFEPHEDCWLLVLTDGGRPECSPEPISSTFKKEGDAVKDLMCQAVDGRLKGFAAVPLVAVLQSREPSIHHGDCTAENARRDRAARHLIDARLGPIISTYRTCNHGRRAEKVDGRHKCS